MALGRRDEVPLKFRANIHKKKMYKTLKRQLAEVAFCQNSFSMVTRWCAVADTVCCDVGKQNQCSMSLADQDLLQEQIAKAGTTGVPTKRLLYKVTCPRSMPESNNLFNFVEMSSKSWSMTCSSCPSLFSQYCSTLCKQQHKTRSKLIKETQRQNASIGFGQNPASDWWMILSLSSVELEFCPYL